LLPRPVWSARKIAHRKCVWTFNRSSKASYETAVRYSLQPMKLPWITFGRCGRRGWKPTLHGAPIWPSNLAFSPHKYTACMRPLTELLCGMRSVNSLRRTPMPYPYHFMQFCGCLSRLWPTFPRASNAAHGKCMRQKPVLACCKVRQCLRHARMLVQLEDVPQRPWSANMMHPNLQKAERYC